MNGMGIRYLHYLISSIISQTYKNYEIVITDHSANNEIENYLRTTYTGTGIKINYIRHAYKRGNSSANTNMAIKYAVGEIIKPMFQDDMFFSNRCLDKIVHEYNNGSMWGAVGFNHISRYNEIYAGEKHKP
jgi:glycosyltransferase involved in cell wall biosynthesis